MSNKDEAPKRVHFRLEYPKEVQPSIQIENKTYSVLNLSEGGVKFSRPKGKPEVFELEDKVFKAKIVFHNSDVVLVTGQAMRFDDTTIVLKFSDGVPYQKVMMEQRFLLKKFGSLIMPKDEKK